MNALLFEDNNRYISSDNSDLSSCVCYVANPHIPVPHTWRMCKQPTFLTVGFLSNITSNQNANVINILAWILCIRERHELADLFLDMKFNQKHVYLLHHTIMYISATRIHNTSILAINMRLHTHGHKWLL